MRFTYTHSLQQSEFNIALINIYFDPPKLTFLMKETNEFITIEDRDNTLFPFTRSEKDLDYYH